MSIHKRLHAAVVTGFAVTCSHEMQARTTGSHLESRHLPSAPPGSRMVLMKLCLWGVRARGIAGTLAQGVRRVAETQGLGPLPFSRVTGCRRTHVLVVNLIHIQLFQSLQKKPQHHQTCAQAFSVPATIPILNPSKFLPPNPSTIRVVLRPQNLPTSKSPNLLPHRSSAEPSFIFLSLRRTYCLQHFPTHVHVLVLPPLNSCHHRTLELHETLGIDVFC